MAHQDSRDGYLLKYKKFSSLLDEVKLDFKNYNIEHYIEPETLLKVARRCNFELGLRINKWDHTILEIEHNKCRLPDNFLKLNYATVCGHHETTIINPQGTYVQEVPMGSVHYTPFNDFKNDCNINKDSNGNKFEALKPTPVFITPCDKGVELVQIIGTQKRIYKHFHPLRMIDSPFINHKSPNRRREFNDGIQFDGFYEFRDRHIDEGWIKDGFLHTTMRCAEVYWNYECSMVDEDGDLIVLSHELIDEYYETALKVQILENAYFEGEDIIQKLNYMKEVAKIAKTKAMSVKRTPDFLEMQDTWSLNRLSFAKRYTNLFAAGM